MAVRPAALLLQLSSLLLASGCAPPPSANDDLRARVTELEQRLGDLERRLAAVPDSEGLDQASLEELVARLGRDDAVARYRAVKELSRREPEDVHRLLLGVVRDGHGREREGAAAVFALEGSSALLPELLVLHGEEEDPRVRALLGLALGRSGGDQVADALIRDLAHPSRTVRLAAVQALDRLGAPVAGGGLLRSALDPDVHVASLARGALGRLPEEAFHFVATEWEWLDPRQRADAIAVLATLEGERPVRFLRERLRDPSPLVALAAARELARRGDASGRTVALERLGSDDPVIARTARQVLDALEAGP